MACPYFMPVEKLENGSWSHPARLPLGGGWRGHCTAPGHEGELPAQDILESFCNLGYANCCTWSPKEHPSDAIRFAVVPPSKSGARAGTPYDASASVICLRYVSERNHLPVDHGDLEFDLQRAIWTRSHADARVQKMAECFLESYLKKKA